MNLWKRAPTQKKDAPNVQNAISMVTTNNGNFYTWNNKLYESDIIRSCIRPKVQAIGKLTAKHIRYDTKGNLKINPEARIRFLLEEPNPYDTAQQMQEKVAEQFCLNNNAFILIVRDENGLPIQLYPVPCTNAEAIYRSDGELLIKFWYTNGKSGIFKYSDIIHMKKNCYGNDIFGTSNIAVISDVMNVVTSIDQGIVHAIKNSAVIRWLLIFKQSLRDEDIKSYVQKFVDNYLSISSKTFGAAGVDSKADVKRIEPSDYIPNEGTENAAVERIYAFFGTNENIVQSKFTEDEWTSYYEAEIEPVVIQFLQTYTNKIFTRKERSVGNKIVFEANNLNCANIKTKLEFLAMVDRGALTPNEWRKILNLAPLPDGDKPIRRLDTQVVNIMETLINKIDSENYSQITAIMQELLKKAGENK